MTESVTVPVHLTLGVQGGGGYQLQGVNITYQANGVNTAVCTLAVGRQEGNKLVSVDIDRGAVAKIFIEPTFGEEYATNAPNGIPISGSNFGALITDLKPIVLFEGRVDDWGPATVGYGAFGVEVRLFGRLVDVAGGTLETNNITPKSYLDTGVAYAFGGGADDFGAIKVSSALGSTGFWPALQEALVSIAIAGPTNAAASASSVTAAIYAAFGTDINVAAADVLSTIRGQLDWRNVVTPAVPGLIRHFNQQLMSNWFYGSFLGAITQLGEQLKFALLEYGSPNAQRPGLAVVPYHPFWSRSQRYQSLGADSWNSFQWVRAQYQTYAGAVLVASTGNETAEGQNGTGNSLVVGLGKVPGFNFGKVHVGPAPGFMAAASEALNTGGDYKSRATRLIIPEDVERNTPAISVRDVIGDPYAMLMALNLNYESRRCRVTSPCLRTDIGPLTAIAVRFPNIPEITSGSATSELGVYGSVQAVTIAIDAAKGFAQTTYDIGYVRSLQQQREIDRMDLVHPFFDSNYLGARLDGDPYEDGFVD